MLNSSNFLSLIFMLVITSEFSVFLTLSMSKEHLFLTGWNFKFHSAAF